MKQCIMLVVCLIMMGVGTAAVANNTDSLQKIEQRIIVPYPVRPPTPSTIAPPSIETMPFRYPERGPYIRPYIRIAPNPEGRGLGTDFGINFGIFRSHGLGFGINLF